MTAKYRGRFAPSPTGPLHAGSLVAALASWLDARAYNGQWLVRIEDLDTPRCVPGADRFILEQLAICGLLPDEPPLWQSQRSGLYQAALDPLIEHDLAYPCACTRQDIALALAAQGHVRARHDEMVYPGTCRHGLTNRPARSWRFVTGFSELKVPGAPGLRPQAAIDSIANSVPAELHWQDRRLGPQAQDLAREVGDFILKRADGLWAYQLAVVVDDAAQGITHVVRGEDLADNTARQIRLQRALGLPTPQYLHVPLVLGDDGDKLSKQNGATPLDLADPLAALRAAGHTLELQPEAGTAGEWLGKAVLAWRHRYG